MERLKAQLTQEQEAKEKWAALAASLGTGGPDSVGLPQPVVQTSGAKTGEKASTAQQQSEAKPGTKTATPASTKKVSRSRRN